MTSINVDAGNPSAFSGAKLMLFAGRDLVVMLRDDIPDIPFPGCWDFPGGGREGSETPAECVLREVREEIGVTLAMGDLVWSRSYPGTLDATWLFAARLPEAQRAHLTLGGEGQMLSFMPPDDYIAHPKNVPHFATRLRVFLSENPGFS